MSRESRSEPAKADVSTGAPSTTEIDSAVEADPTTGATSDADLPTLSVVVIARNEEDRIGQCLESVLAATEAFDSEVVVVDSNSTDRTVARAADYPVSVLRIPTDDLSTPSAGRYVGTQHARGEQVLFVDGDMILSDEWLETAAETLDARPNLAGVGGYLDEAVAAGVEEVEWLNGVALYDADALESVGGFDPYLRALEDLHLGFELTREGYRLVRLPTVVSDHDREPSGYLEPLRRWRRGFFHGVADVFFRSASSPRLLAKHLWEKRYVAATGVWLLFGVASLVALPAFGLWLGASVAGVAVLALTQGVERAYNLVTLWVFVWAGILSHEWRAPRDPDSYPVERVEQVVSGPRLE